jgi:hypothetical protein
MPSSFRCSSSAGGDPLLHSSFRDLLTRQTLLIVLGRLKLPFHHFELRFGLLREHGTRICSRDRIGLHALPHQNSRYSDGEKRDEDDFEATFHDERFETPSPWLSALRLVTCSAPASAESASQRAGAGLPASRHAA